ncbi:MAG: hypothetical protein PHT72_03445 [Candidatus Absconditabacteria bacterium]|nr:hypothetical protein [Candidatus Absconditabacteria bacterium]
MEKKREKVEMFVIQRNESEVEEGDGTGMTKNLGKKGIPFNTSSCSSGIRWVGEYTILIKSFDR